MTAAFDFKSTGLPICDVVDEVRHQLKQSNTLLINAPAGAGKSTVLPLTLLKEDWLADQKIIMLEPRRLAARTIAQRMADLLQEKVGETVGYRIRFENVIGNNTRIEVVTEGVLTRMLQQDNSLEGVGAVIFDEFHERSLFADVALALSREAQQIVRPDLRLIIMSATLDMPQLSTLLQCSTVTSQGRQYPVDIIYTGESDVYAMPELTARQVVKALQEQHGDVLVFLPGEGEIKKCEALLKGQVGDTQVHCLYGQLSMSKQYAALMPDRQGRRKVVLATSIAETSLTIEGISVVVDTGYGRIQCFDPRSGLSRLETIEITQDAADQRAGRAGRLGPGTCYRMWSLATHDRKAAHRSPEIVEADLASLVLDMAIWGVDDIPSMCWLTPPPKGHLAQAAELLHQLEALERGKITPHGKLLHRLPCHPRIAHMLLMAEEHGLSALATDLAALLEERDPLGKEAGIDITKRIDALRRYRSGDFKSKSISRIEKIARQYRQLLKVDGDNSPVDPFEAGMVLVFAYPERIAHARPGNNAQFKLANGALAMAGHADDLAHEAWLAVAHVNARDEVGRIFLAAPLDPRDLAPMVKKVQQLDWDTKRGGFKAVEELRIGHIVLQTKPLAEYDQDLKVAAICRALSKEGAWLLNFTDEVTQWQNRVLSLREWNTDEHWPDVSTHTLLTTTEQWLAPYLTTVRTPDDLKRIDLLDVLHHSLDYQQQQRLNELAPSRIEVPSGSHIKLRYHEDGATPVLAVRLQEVFGLLDTPTVNNGKQKVLLHLLSPGFKPVQITGDLRSFWSNAYFEVRKELKARYPKHEWPDKPLEATAIRGVKRKG